MRDPLEEEARPRENHASSRPDTTLEAHGQDAIARGDLKLSIDIPEADVPQSTPAGVCEDRPAGKLEKAISMSKVLSASREFDLDEEDVPIADCPNTCATNDSSTMQHPEPPAISDGPSADISQSTTREASSHPASVGARRNQLQRVLDSPAGSQLLDTVDEVPGDLLSAKSNTSTFSEERDVDPEVDMVTAMFEALPSYGVKTLCESNSRTFWRLVAIVSKGSENGRDYSIVCLTKLIQMRKAELRKGHWSFHDTFVDVESTWVTGEEAGVLQPLLSMAKNGTPACQAYALTAIRFFALVTEDRRLFDRAGAFELVVDMIRPPTDERVQGCAARALYSFLCEKGKQAKLLKSNALPDLARLCAAHNKEAKHAAAAVLHKLVHDGGHATCLALVEVENAVSYLVDLVHEGSMDGCATLGYLATESEEVRQMVLECHCAGSLIAMLDNDAHSRLHAARLLRKIASVSEAGQTQILENGGVEPLIDALSVRAVSAGDKQVANLSRQEAAAALRNLALKNDRAQVAIATAGGIKALRQMILDPTALGQDAAADALRSLAEHSQYKLEIAKAGGIKPLVAMISDGTPSGKGHAAMALAQLATENPSNQETIIRSGVLAPLVDLLQHGSIFEKAAAAAAFDVLMASSNLNQSLVREAGGVAAIVNALIEFSKQHAGPLAEMVVKQPVITPAKEAVGNVVSSAVGLTAAVVSGKDASEKVRRITLRLKEYEKYACRSMLSCLLHMTSPPRSPTVGDLAFKEESRKAVIDAHGYEPLLRICRAGEQRNQEVAHKIVWYLCTKEENCRKLGLAMGDKRSYEALASENMWARSYAAAALSHKSELVPFDCLQFGTPRVLQNVVEMMQEGNLQTRKFVTLLIKRMLKQDIDNGSNFLLVSVGLSGVIKWLVRLLKTELHELGCENGGAQDAEDLDACKVHCAAILGLLASKPDAVVDIDDIGRVSFQDVVGRAGAIPLLIRMLTSPDKRQNCNAAGALWSLVSHNHTVNQLAIFEAGGVPPLARLALVATDQTQISSMNALKWMAQHYLIRPSIDALGALPWPSASE
mmetsp:Transcript_7367/g.27078  ORF Transcript_7367/g.27078 Transcript_7367/m.27078 type:complete len:1057 (+) Transcript_7367:217-3387(+)